MRYTNPRLYFTFLVDLSPAARSHLFEATSELVAHSSVDERISGTASKAGPVSGEHREEKLRVSQEAVGLQLGDRRHCVERSPAEHERHGH